MKLNNKHLCIATPMYGGMCTSFYLNGVVDTVSFLQGMGHKVNLLQTINDSLVTRARNTLVQQFLNSDADYLLFVDADIGFCGNDVLKLLNADKDIICGLYPKKFIDWDRIELAAKQGYTDLRNYASSFVANSKKIIDPEQPLTSSVVEVSHAGTGFMLIKRDVFKLLSPFVKSYRPSTLSSSNGDMLPLLQEFFATDIVGEDKYFLSEDYFFCDLWARYGGAIYADISINLTHFGNYNFRGNLSVGGLNATH